MEAHARQLLGFAIAFVVLALGTLHVARIICERSRGRGESAGREGVGHFMLVRHLCCAMQTWNKTYDSSGFLNAHRPFCEHDKS